MYEDNGVEDDLKLSMEEFSYPLHNLPSGAMEMNMDMDSCGGGGGGYTPHADHILSSNWADIGFHHLDPPYPPTPDLLNLLHVPGYSPADNGSVPFDPLFHLNLPPQHPLFQSLPHAYALPPSINAASLFGAGDEREGIGAVYLPGDAQHYDAVLEFAENGRRGRKTGRGRTAKPITTERDRRNQLSDKYSALRSLVPNPTKGDRASIVSDAIGYIKELQRSVDELKILVEKKRSGREMNKRRKKEEDGGCGGDGEVESCETFNGSSMRSSWLQRKSKDTEVDVRLIDDEVTIKLVQRKKINSLLFVSKVLDELQLDLHHIAGGNIGDYYSFMFNTKIQEGSCVYASVIANKLIEVADRQYAGIALAGGY